MSNDREKKSLKQNLPLKFSLSLYSFLNYWATHWSCLSGIIPLPSNVLWFQPCSEALHECLMTLNSLISWNLRFLSLYNPDQTHSPTTQQSSPHAFNTITVAAAVSHFSRVRLCVTPSLATFKILSSPVPGHNTIFRSLGWFLLIFLTFTAWNTPELLFLSIIISKVIHSVQRL